MFHPFHLPPHWLPSKGWLTRVHSDMLSIDFLTKRMPGVATTQGYNSAVTYLRYQDDSICSTTKDDQPIFITHMHWLDSCGHSFTVSHHLPKPSTLPNMTVLARTAACLLSSSRTDA